MGQLVSRQAQILRSRVVSSDHLAKSVAVRYSSRMPSKKSFTLYLTLLFPLLLSACSSAPPPDDDDTSASDDDDTSASDDDDTSASDDDDDSAGDDDDSAGDDDDTSGDDDTAEPNPTDDGDGIEDDLIYAVQDGTIPEGTRVDIKSVVVTGADYLASGNFNGVFVQEPLSGPDSGIWVYTSSEQGAFTVGQMVDIIAWTEEYRSDSSAWPVDETVTELNVGSHTASEGTGSEDASMVLSTATPATITPEVVDAAIFATADVERYEGVLITVEGISATSSEDNFGNWTTNIGMQISNKLFTYSPDTKGVSQISTGQSFTSITGVLDQNYGSYKLCPRGAFDFLPE